MAVFVALSIYILVFDCPKIGFNKDRAKDDIEYFDTLVSPSIADWTYEIFTFLAALTASSIVSATITPTACPLKSTSLPIPTNISSSYVVYTALGVKLFLPGMSVAEKK